ncbi:feS assembly ATPase SufC [Clostridium sp. CAG:1219]|nr:feS assembly ATPase SufC [Clostridium sp. CAG:1219]
MENLLSIENLYVNAGEKEILKGLNLNIKRGEIHVIMGPNGAGKSTLANVILNNPEYKKISGNVLFEGENINDLTTDKISNKGIFMSFQTPEEIPGISTSNFIRVAKSKVEKSPVKLFKVKEEIKKYADELNMNKKLLDRNLNVGFSGGEKKKNEILQMLVLNPKLAILDETDSGLDIDSVRVVSKGINLYKNENNAVLIITHNMRILESLNVDKVHILIDGKIVKTGGNELIHQVEENGFSKYKK